MLHVAFTLPQSIALSQQSMLVVGCEASTERTAFPDESAKPRCLLNETATSRGGHARDTVVGHLAFVCDLGDVRIKQSELEVM